MNNIITYETKEAQSQFPDISVVVITYNQEMYIRECLDSIIDQVTQYSFEIIIGEDCSTDDTLLVCQEYLHKYPQHIRILHSIVNQGFLRNYFSTLSASRGKYIAPCAGDDYWCDQYKLQKEVDFIKNNSGYSFVRTSGYALVEGKLEDATSYHTTAEGDISHIAIYGPIALASSVLFEKTLLKYIDFEEILNRGILSEDYLTFSIWSFHTKMGFIPDKSIVYRINQNSMSHTKDWNRRMRMAKSAHCVAYYLQDLYRDKLPAYFKQSVDDKYYLKLLRIYYEQFNYRQAKKIVKLIQLSSSKQKKMVIFAHNILTFLVLAIYKKING